MHNNKPDVDVGHEEGEGAVTADWRVGRSWATGGTKGHEASRNENTCHLLMAENAGQEGSHGAKSDVAGGDRESWSLGEEERQSVVSWVERRQQKCGRHRLPSRAFSPLIRTYDFYCRFYELKK